MPITLNFALDVQRLNRQGLTVERIARRLRASVDDVREAHRFLLLPVNDMQEPVKHRTDAEREAEFERMPLRVQKRIDGARKH